MDIAKIMLFFVIIAAIAVTIGALIAGIANYWPYLLLIGGVVFGLYYFKKKQTDKANQV